MHHDVVAYHPEKLMPIPRLEPRPYQTECLQRTIPQNTIVNLPTGMGKTLIAIRTIDHFRRVAPSSKIVFVVPKRVC